MNSTSFSPTRTCYMPEPNCGRGTLRIVWSCLTTAFLSLWTAYHPLVGHPTDSRLRWFMRKCLRPYLSIFVPEITVAQSLHQLCEAFLLKRDMALLPGFKHFSLRQAFLVVIGGVYYELPISDSLVDDHLRDTEQQHQGSGNNLRYKRLSPKKLLELASTREINFEQLPENSDIDDRSKSDSLLKLISIFQTIWFIANMKFRLALGYTISLFEVTTTSFALCGLIQLIAWIRCPQNICKPFLLKLRSEAEREKDRFISEKPQISWLLKRQIRFKLRPHPPTVQLEIATLPEPEKPQDTRLRRMLENKLFRISVIRWLTLTIVTIISLAIHLGPWTYSFQNIRAKWQWRSSSLLLALCTFFMMEPDGQEFSALEPNADDDSEANISPSWCRIILIVLAGLGSGYTRCGLLGLASQAFKNAPMDIYKEASWTTFVPHF